MTIKQLSIFVQNQPGALADVTGLLAQNNIDIRALSLAEAADYGILRLIVTDPAKAVDVLQNANCLAKITDVLAVAMNDAPGGMHRTVEALSRANISIEYAYAFILRKQNKACVILRVRDPEAACTALAAQDIRVLSESELQDL